VIILIERMIDGHRHSMTIAGAGPGMNVDLLRSHLACPVENLLIRDTRDRDGCPIQVCVDRADREGRAVILSYEDKLPSNALVDDHGPN
jgi:hypothetical protein